MGRAWGDGHPPAGPCPMIGALTPGVASTVTSGVPVLYARRRLPSRPAQVVLSGVSMIAFDSRWASEDTASRASNDGTSYCPPWEDEHMAATNTPPLSAQLCFDLYAASRAVTHAYRPVLNELGLTYPQYLVLIVLWEEGTRTVKELADTLRLDHGTLTPLLRRMEGNGLVVRRRANADERFVEIALTPSGDALRAHGAGIHCDMKAALGLDDAQFVALQETLRGLTARVTQSRQGNYDGGRH